MTRNDIERKQRQEKLANLFFEMGMDLDLIEKMSGVDKKELLNSRKHKNKTDSVPFNMGTFNENYSAKNRSLYQ